MCMQEVKQVVTLGKVRNALAKFVQWDVWVREIGKPSLALAIVHGHSGRKFEGRGTRGGVTVLHLSEITTLTGQRQRLLLFGQISGT